MLKTVPIASRSFSPSVALAARRACGPPLGDRLEHRPGPAVLLGGNVHSRVRLKQLVDRIGRRSTDAYDGVEPTANRGCLCHRERSRVGRCNCLRKQVMAALTKAGGEERVEGGDAALP